jgi:hypothetical protein
VTAATVSTTQQWEHIYGDLRGGRLQGGGWRSGKDASLWEGERLPL